MASIAITQGFDAITSIYNPIIINFTRVDSTNAVGCLLTVGSVSKYITPVFVGTNQFTVDLTDVIRYMVPLPPHDVNNTSQLSVNVSLAVSMAGATTQTITTVACYGHRELDLESVLGESTFYTFDFVDIYYSGRGSKTNLPIYTDGFISFYNKNAAGVYTAEIEGAYVKRTIVFGRLYSQSIARSGNIGLNGFDTPTYDDCFELLTLAGGTSNDLAKYKSADSNYWYAPNANAANLFGLDLRGGGFYNGSAFAGKKNIFILFHKTGNLAVTYDFASAINISEYASEYYSLRLTKPATPEQLLLADGTRVEDYTDYEKNRYVCRKIGSKIWMCESLITAFRADGTHMGISDYKDYNNDIRNSFTDVMQPAVTAEYYLRQGYNNIQLPYNDRKSGIFTLEFSGTTISLPLIYRDNTEFEDEGVYWLNSNGCWSRWNFNKRSITYENKEDERLPMRQVSAQYIGSDRTLSKSKTVTVNLETVAIDTRHYIHLAEMMETPMLIYRGLIWEVVQNNIDIATCRQNLYFNLKLRTSQYVVKY